MKTVVLTQPEQMLFALLRASLHDKDVEIKPFQAVSDDVWKQCYHLAARQGVMALAWDGVVKLASELQPPRALRLTWGMAVQQYEEKYRRYCLAAHELSVYYASQGIGMMQMKGVGLSAHYPVPCHREGGDIDIFTYSLNTSRMSDAEANHLADELMNRQNIKVETDRTPKHSNFYYKGIPVENHKMFVNVNVYKEAEEVEKLLWKHIHPELTSLLDGTCEVYTPSATFNTLFISFHAMQHYGCGMTLHHLCDWAMLIKHYELHIPSELKGKNFLRALAAFTRLCNDYLGTDVPVEANEKLVHEILDEVLHSRYMKDVPYSFSKPEIILFKLRRMLYFSKRQRTMFDRSLWEVVCNSVVAHLRRPETIFQRGLSDRKTPRNHSR